MAFHYQFGKDFLKRVIPGLGQECGEIGLLNVTGQSINWCNYSAGQFGNMLLKV